MGSRRGMEEDEKTGGTAGEKIRPNGASGGGRRRGAVCVNDDQSLRWSASLTRMVRSAILLPLSRMALSKCSLFSQSPKPIPLEKPFSSFRMRTRKRLTSWSLKQPRRVFSSIQYGTPPMKISRSFLFSIACFFRSRNCRYSSLSVSSSTGNWVHSCRSMPLYFARYFLSFSVTTSVRYFSSQGMLKTTPFSFSYFCIPLTDSWRFLGNYSRRKFQTYLRELNSTSISRRKVTYPGMPRWSDLGGQRRARSSSNSRPAASSKEKGSDRN